MVKETKNADAQHRSLMLVEPLIYKTAWFTSSGESAAL